MSIGTIRPFSRGREFEDRKIVVPLLKDQNRFLGISLRGRVVENFGNGEPLRTTILPAVFEGESGKVFSKRVGDPFVGAQGV